MEKNYTSLESAYQEIEKLLKRSIKLAYRGRMIDMLFKESSKLSRRFLANKHQHISVEKRLATNKSNDLRNNAQIEDLQNGFVRISPINATKTISKPIY